MRYLRHARLVILVCLVGFGTPTTVRAQDLPIDAFDAYIRQAFEDWNAVGLAVAVVKDGELLFARGYGEQELGSGRMVNEETRFSIGSTTKAMTAATVGILVDEGKVDWDDPVVKHLPWFQLSDSWMTREITVRDLLTHRAGLGNADLLWFEHPVSRDWVVKQIRHADLVYSPRSGFIYQNIMYAAAGLLVEAVSGMPWAEFVERKIFQPLGMTESFSLLAKTRDQPNVARPHDIVDGERVVIENASVDPVDAAGSVWSSVEDMSRWLRMLLAGGVTPEGARILSENVVEEMFRPQTIVHGEMYPTVRVTKPNWMTYGLAWFQHDFRGHKLDFHTGSIDGMVAIAGLIRDQNLGVYVLGNRDHVEVRHALMYRALDYFLAPNEMRDWSAELKTVYDDIAHRAAAAQTRRVESRVPNTHPSQELNAYTGTFTNETYGEITVEVRDGTLFITRSPGLKGPASHWHYDTFMVDLEAQWRGDLMATFQTGTTGTVDAVVFYGRRWERETGDDSRETRQE